MTPSPAFLRHVSEETERAERDLAEALEDRDDSAVAVARGRLADLAELVKRTLDEPLGSWA